MSFFSDFVDIDTAYQWARVIDIEFGFGMDSMAPRFVTELFEVAA
jgi:hypothetical protein